MWTKWSLFLILMITAEGQLMTLRLTPGDKESRIYIDRMAPGAANPTGQWSLLVPECISCREGTIPWLHTWAPQWIRSGGGWEVRLAVDGRSGATAYQLEGDVLRQRRLNDRLAFVSTCRLIVVDNQTVEINFRIRNTGKCPMTDTEADFCFSCIPQPEFAGEEWYHRSYVHVVEPRAIDNEPHYAGKLVPVGDARTHFPVALNSPLALFGKNVCDVPLILCRSLDGRKVYAAGFERCIRLSTSAGTCIHADPWLGTIEPGREATCRGRFYYVTGRPEDVLARFAKDFGSQKVGNTNRASKVSPAGESRGANRAKEQ